MCPLQDNKQEAGKQLEKGSEVYYCNFQNTHMCCGSRLANLGPTGQGSPPALLS